MAAEDSGRKVGRTRFTDRLIGDVPVLIAQLDDVPNPAPVVVWFHGLGVDKETHRTELQQLAEAGLCAVGIDAVGHGARRLSNLQALIDAPREQAFATAVDLAVQTAREVPRIIDVLTGTGLADPDRVSLAGISMGAFVVYRALVECREINKAVAILGAPRWPFPHSPHDQIDAFCATELLSITAEHDENVPPAAARELHLALETRCPTRHRYVELRGAVHLMNEADWNQTMQETLGWLRPDPQRAMG